MPIKMSWRIQNYTFTLVISAYYALVLNAPLLAKAFSFIHEENTLYRTIVLLIPFTLFLFLVAWSLITLFSIKKIQKPFLIILTPLSALISYFYVFYGVMFNNDSPIIGAIFQTNLNEIRSFFAPSLWIWLFLFGLLPCYFIYNCKIIREKQTVEIIWKCLGLMSYPCFYLFSLLPTLPAYQPMLILSGLVARPPFQITPTNFFENLSKFWINKIHFKTPYKTIGLDAYRDQKKTVSKPQLIVFIIGETARSQNFSLNGYDRPTNPYTSQKKVVSYKHVSACSTLTWVSVPCIFSHLPHRQFIPFMSPYRDNLLDILKRLGIQLLWIDNNGAGNCQGACKHVDTILLDDLDGAITESFKANLNHLRKQDTFIVLHLHGSHGPDYYQKYPPHFSVYKPDCRKNDFRLCSKKKLINAYDNSLIYSDFVVDSIIELLHKVKSEWNSAMIYTSDHGESLGEKNRYGHGLPYFMAPEEQTQVPLLVWISNEFLKDEHLSKRCLINKADLDSVSHDYLFHTMLGLFHVKTKLYDAGLDLFKNCRKLGQT